MNSILQDITSMFPDQVYNKAKFNAGDFLALLQGMVGFAKAILNKSPLDFIDTALEVAELPANKACLKSLESYMGSIKQWLTFGKHYQPLVDSSDLDFDELDVGSVPQIMQVRQISTRLLFYGSLIKISMRNAISSLFKQWMKRRSVDILYHCYFLVID